MLLVDDRRYIATPFDDEDELEQVVLDNYELVFGPDAVMLPKKLIRSPDGAGTIPDAFAVDLLARRWFIVEAELAAHGVWRHIAPQVSKQLVAARGVQARKALVETLVEFYKTSVEIREKFEEHGVAEIDVRGFLNEIFESDPVVAIPIDTVTNDLELWADTLNVSVRLWEVRKLADFDDPSRVAYEVPDEHRPTVDTSKGASSDPTWAVYDVSILDLLDAQLLEEGDQLEMPYKPRGGEQRTYHAKVNEDGSLTVLGERFSSPSYAALRGINDAGSPRKTVNGWTSWRASSGRTLADLRAEYLEREDAPDGYETASA